MDDEHNKKLNEYLSDLSTSMAAKAMDVELNQKNKLDEIALKYEEVQTKRSLLDDQGFDSPDGRLIGLLEAQIGALEGRLLCADALIETLIFRIESLESANALSDIANDFSDRALDVQDKMITHQATKIDKYKNGPKKKSLDSQQKWALANDYFKEEIPLHRTLKAARLEAAKKAGIVVEQRQLTKKMPTPR